MRPNVEEFVTWGPLVEGPDGKTRPCPKRKGREFNAFRNALQQRANAAHYELAKAVRELLTVFCKSPEKFEALVESEAAIAAVKREANAKVSGVPPQD